MPMVSPKMGRKIPILSLFGRSQESSPCQVGFASLRAGNRSPQAESQEGAGMAGVILVSLWKPALSPAITALRYFLN